MAYRGHRVTLPLGSAGAGIDEIRRRVPGTIPPRSTIVKLAIEVGVAELQRLGADDLARRIAAQPKEIA